jgi:hypothetical protein
VTARFLGVLSLGDLARERDPADDLAASRR